MGKWSHLKDSLPRLEDQDPTYQSKINAAKAELLSTLPPQERGNLGALGDLYNGLRVDKEALNSKLYDVNLNLEALTQVLVDKLEETGLTQIRLTDGSSLSLKDDPYSRISDRPKFIAWVREQGLEALLTVNYQSANALVKERLENGEAPPEGVEVFIKTSLTRRKA